MPREIHAAKPPQHANKVRSCNPRLIPLLAVILLINSCGGGGGGNVPPPITNAVPSVTSLSPSSVTAGAVAQTLTINGGNFLSTSTVTYNGVAHAATFVSSNQLTISLSASEQATAGVFPVSVTNPAPGGGASIPVNFTVTNPSPTISSISPTSVTAGGAAFLLTVNGTGFVATSTVNFNNAGQTTTFVSATQITAAIPASAVTSPSNTSVTVTNPVPGGGTSSLAPFVVAAAQGVISVTIIGLPNGASASVTLSGPNGFTTQLTSSQTLQVAIGAYTVTGNPVGAGTSNYYPAVTSQTGTVSTSATTSVTVDYSTIIPKSTKVLDPGGMSSLTISPDGSTITLPTSSPVAASLAIGDVLASAPAPAAPSGLLIKILSVNTSGPVVTASVQQATLEDAIQQATFDFSEALGPGNTTSNAAMNRRIPTSRSLDRFRARTSAAIAGACAGNSNTIQLPFSVPLVQGNNGSLTLTGEDDFCTSFNLHLQITGFHLISLNATATVANHTSMTLIDSVQGNFNNSHDLATFAATPTVAVIGGVPIVVKPILTPFVGASGDASASASTGVTTDSTLTIGVSYANGAWSNTGTALSPTAVSSSTSVDGEVNLKGFAGVRAGVVLDGVLTPSLSGDGYLQFSSSLTGNPCWSLTAGLEANVGVNVTILGHSLVDYTSPSLNLFSVPVLQATNTCFAPELNNVTPNVALVGSPQITVALSGSNFVPDSVANLNGQPLTTTFLNPTDLTAVIPSSKLGTAGVFPFTVLNPDNPGGTSPSVPFTVGSVTVSISPISAFLKVSTNQQFKAKVQGNSNIAVSWSVNGIVGGNSTIGTITQAGIYSAPSGIPDPPTVTIIATSLANPTAVGSAGVTVTTLDNNFLTINYPNAMLTYPSGVNNSGQVIGSFLDQTGTYHGFLYASGNFSAIDYPGAINTYAAGINDSGQIVGEFRDQASITHGFLDDGGIFSPVDVPCALGTAAHGISDSGQITGWYQDQAINKVQACIKQPADLAVHGFVFVGAVFTSIDDPSALQTPDQGTVANSVNDSGQIVGWFTNPADGVHGFLYSGGSFSSFDYPGSPSTNPSGIRDSGKIVGDYVNPGARGEGFIYSNGIFMSFDYPSALATGPNGINDSGQIVGIYYDQAQVQHGFISIPNK